MIRKIREVLLGKPLPTSNWIHERLTNTQGLAIFASDALSSTAYATEEILIVLAGAALTGFISIPLALAITALVFVVTLSYQQVIHAYPQGGGVYNVARKNLGETPALVGASSLLIDYVLTAAVSVAAGVAAITSAIPELFPNRVLIGVLFILALTWANLRGVRESGRLFTLPTYLFIFSFLGMIGYGIFRHATGTLPPTPNEISPVSEPLGILGIFLILRAFAGGCTALTGIEATSNGVQAFKPPESANAGKTILRMAVLLGTIFLGITVLSAWLNVTPRPSETVISQIARMLFGGGPLYYIVQAATMLILLLAANTPFAGFPRVASQLAKDGYFPRQFLNLGSKLVFANGIMALAGFAAFLIFFFRGNVHALIPLYAVGVFLGFSLSQLGMIRHWRRAEGRHIRSIAINTIGFGATAVVFAIVFTTKFTQGAWILIPAGLILVLGMKKIHTHYQSVEERLALSQGPVLGVFQDKTVVVLVGRLNRAALHAVRLAKTLKPAHLRAVHVAVDPKEGGEIQAQWKNYVQDKYDVPLDVLVSEYRDLIGPILDYLKKIGKSWKKDTVYVVISEIVPEKPWQHFLHNQTAAHIRAAIEQDPDIQAEIIDVPVKVTTKL